MRLRSSDGYDANDVVPHHVDNEQHSAIDKANGVETKFAGAADIVELDHIRSKNTFAAVRKPIPCFFRLAFSLAVSHSKSIAGPCFQSTDIQYLWQGCHRHAAGQSVDFASLDPPAD